MDGRPTTTTTTTTSASANTLREIEPKSFPSRIRRLKTLRIFLGVILGLLYLQFELGMETNLANPPLLPPIQFSIPHIFQYLGQIGGQAVLHASNGILIFSISLVIVYLSLRTKIRSIMVFGCAAPAAIIFAMMNGALFTLSGFQNDGPSFGMAHAFIATFTLYAVELYFVAKWIYMSRALGNNSRPTISS